MNSHQDVENAISQYSTAARSISGPTLPRFIACSRWAQLIPHLHHSPLEAYTLALELLPQLAWLGLSVTDRHRHLLEASDVVRNAVAAAIDASQLDKAIQWLEQGRSIIWSQVLQLRTPLDHLKNVHPELAGHLSYLSKTLEGATVCDVMLPVSGGHDRPSPSEVAVHYHDLAHEREELVKKIRTLDGFEGFLSPKSLADLLPAANNGPVVILNVSSSRSDALVLIPSHNDILHIPLPDFNFNIAHTLQKSLKMLLTTSDRRTSGDLGRAGQLALFSQPIEADFKYILSQLWLLVVKPVLDVLAINVFFFCLDL